MKSITKQVNKRQITGRPLSQEMQSRVKRREKILKRTKARLTEERRILRGQGDIGSSIVVGARLRDVTRMYEQNPLLFYINTPRFHAAYQQANITPREVSRRNVLASLDM